MTVREQRDFEKIRIFLHRLFPNKNIAIIIEIFPIISYCSRACNAVCKRVVIKVGGREGENVLISSLKGNNVAEIRRGGGGGGVISGVAFIERRFGDTCVL